MAAPICTVCSLPLRLGEPFDVWHGLHLHRECAAGSTETCGGCGEIRTYTQCGNWIHPHGTVWCAPKKENA